MITKCIQIDNYPEICDARDNGYPVPEQECSWADFWVDLNMVIAAKSTVTVQGEMAISLWLDGDENFLVPDTPEIRKQLDERFSNQIITDPVSELIQNLQNNTNGIRDLMNKVIR